MFYSNIQAVNNHHIYPEIIQKSIEYLREHDFSSMETGVYEIDGKMRYIQVIELETKPYEIGRFETHEEYVDIQFLVRGNESIGFASRFSHHEPVEILFDRDLYFYDIKVENETILMLKEGDFAIFFPGDLHKPGLQANGKESIKKVVMKVNVKLLQQI